MHTRAIASALLVVGLAFLGGGRPASADVFGSYTCDPTLSTCNGTVPVVGGNFDLVSNTTTTGAAGLFLQITGTLTLSQIVDLSAEYDMTTGTFAGGAPRFTLFDSSFNSAWIYWGTPLGGGSFSNPNPNGTFANTGNYADLSSPDVRVYVNGFGGQNTPNTGETWNAFVSALGSTDLSFISLDLDAGTFAGSQEMLVSSFTVNDQVDTPAPVPEPTSLALLGAGLLVFGAFRGRKAA